MKPAIWMVTALCVGGMANAQEPLNNAVRQPSVSQASVYQPSVQQVRDPVIPSVYEPFVFQPLANVPHQVPQASVVRPEVTPAPEPQIETVRHITPQDIPTGCACPNSH